MMKRHNINLYIRRMISLLVLICFFLTSLNPPVARAQDYLLPAPGIRVGLSPEFNPPILKGIKVHPDNPFRFDFIMDRGDSSLSSPNAYVGDLNLKQEANRLIKYFLASLTIPENDLWVNLSPYEKNRIIPPSFGLTEMGRDLLAEDYMLKQITASLIYPEGEVGKRFWRRVYEEAAKKFGTTNIPVNTFNKVWIVPEKAVVYENAQAGTAYVVESKLKVMLEEDYLSIKKHTVETPFMASHTSPFMASLNRDAINRVSTNNVNALGSNIVREIVIPELTKEVNEDKNFARLRQVYNSLILAAWYKRKIKDSILSQIYEDKKKVAGVNIDDPNEKQRIYQQYLRAFKKGVYNYIKEDLDPVTQETVPRKYFSGGMNMNLAMTVLQYTSKPDPASIAEASNGQDMVLNVNAEPINSPRPSFAMAPDKAMEAIQGFLKNDRSLFRSDNVDDVYAALSADVHKTDPTQKILRLTLRNDEDVQRVWTTLHVDAKGKDHITDGPLKQIILEGGILLLDYNGTDPKIAMVFNDLYGKVPRLFGVQVPEENRSKLKIIGVIDGDRLMDYSSDFYERFYEGPKHVFEENKELNPTFFKGDNFDGVVADIWGAPQVRDQLEGTYQLEKNNIKVLPGKIIEAIKSGKSRMLLRGGIWDDRRDSRGNLVVSELRMAVRDIILNKGVWFNGEFEPLPEGFKFFYQDVDDYTKGVADQGPSQKRILAPGEGINETTEPAWVINSVTQDLLTSRVHIVDHQLTQNILNPLLNLPHVRLRITEDLEDWVWHLIMHAQGQVDIEVSPGVYIPPAYFKFSSSQARSNNKPKIVSWEETQDAQAVLIETTDLSYATQMIKAREANAVVYPVDLETSSNELVSSIQMKRSDAKSAWEFHPQFKDVIKMLKEGKTVILQGAQANPSLLQELEGVLYGKPYLVDNGERVFFRGKLYITVQQDAVPDLDADHHVIMDTNEENLRQFAGIAQDDYKKIMEIRDALDEAHITADFSLPSLRLMAKYHNWVEAFDNIKAVQFHENPEVEAFIRVMAKVYFAPEVKSNQIDESRLMAILNKGVLGTDWDSIYWQLADAISPDLLRSIGIFKTYSNRSSEVYDLIQKALIKKYAEADPLRAEYYRQRFHISEGTSVSDAPDMVLVQAAHRSSSLPQKLRNAWNFSPLANLLGPQGTGKSYTAKEVAQMLTTIGPNTAGPDFRQENVIISERMTPKGAQYNDEAVARWAKVGTVSIEELNKISSIANTKFSPDAADSIWIKTSDELVRANPDITLNESDLDAIPADDRKIFWDAYQYSKNNPGAVLIYDEANLPKNGFWNPLIGLFDDNPYIWIQGKKIMLTKNHKVIFTGNPYSFPGRHRHDLIDRYGITIYFDPLSRDELKEIMTNDSKPYVPSNVQDSEGLVNNILDLHFLFERMSPAGQFTLRDIQTTVDRVLHDPRASWALRDQQSIVEALSHPKTTWTMKDVVMAVWSIYKGQFSTEEQAALKELINMKYGINVNQEELRRSTEIIRKFADAFAAKGVALVRSNSLYVEEINTSLFMRIARMNGYLRLDGKRGMIAEASPGWGKDVTSLEDLEQWGYRNAQSNQANADPTLNYYLLSTSMSDEEMLNIIEKAKVEGSIILAPELNSLPSAFLEGKLNDALTGSTKDGKEVHPGFFFIATINSADFSGREKLSSALLNRLVYQRFADYSESDLEKVVDLEASRNGWAVTASDIQYAVKAHLWVKDKIQVPKHRPGTRKLLQAVEMSAREHIPIDVAFRNIYKPFYLDQVLHGEVVLPLPEDLRKASRDPMDKPVFMQNFAGYIVPRFKGKINVVAFDQNDKSAPQGNYKEASSQEEGPTIGVAKSLVSDYPALIEELSRQAGLGLFSGDVETNNEFQREMENLRTGLSLNRNFPYSRLAGGSMDFKAWLTAHQGTSARQIFWGLAALYLNDKIDRQWLEQNEATIDSILCDGQSVAFLLEHIDQLQDLKVMSPATTDQEDILYQASKAIDYQASDAFKQMENDYIGLSAEPTIPKVEVKADLEAALATPWEEPENIAAAPEAKLTVQEQQVISKMADETKKKQQKKFRRSFIKMVLFAVVAGASAFGGAAYVEYKSVPVVPHVNNPSPGTGHGERPGTGQGTRPGTGEGTGQGTGHGIGQGARPGTGPSTGPNTQPNNGPKMGPGGVGSIKEFDWKKFIKDAVLITSIVLLLKRFIPKMPIRIVRIKSSSSAISNQFIERLLSPLGYLIDKLLGDYDYKWNYDWRIHQTYEEKGTVLNKPKPESAPLDIRMIHGIPRPIDRRNTETDDPKEDEELLARSDYFIKSHLVSDWGLGKTGQIKAEPFLRTQNIERARISRKGVWERNGKKRIFLKGLKYANDTVHPIVKDAMQFLVDHGYEIHMISDNFTEDDLRTNPKYSEDALMDISEFKRFFEDIYLYYCFQYAHSNYLQEPVSIAPRLDHSYEGQLTSEEFEYLGQLVRKKIVQHESFTISDGTVDGIAIQPSRIREVDLSRLPHINFIVLPSGKGYAKAIDYLDAVIDNTNISQVLFVGNPLYFSRVNNFFGRHQRVMWMRSAVDEVAEVKDMELKDKLKFDHEKFEISMRLKVGRKFTQREINRLRNLSYLFNFYGDRINDIDYLKEFRKLKKVFIGGNSAVTDFSPLFGLPLRELIIKQRGYIPMYQIAQIFQHHPHPQRLKVFLADGTQVDYYSFILKYGQDIIDRRDWETPPEVIVKVKKMQKSYFAYLVDTADSRSLVEVHARFERDNDYWSYASAARLVPSMVEIGNAIHAYMLDAQNAKNEEIRSVIGQMMQELKGKSAGGNAAQLAIGKNGKGGIDFTANKTPLEIQNAGARITFHLNPAMLEQLKNAPGFEPKIIDMQPLTDLKAFLGITADKPTA